MNFLLSLLPQKNKFCPMSRNSWKDPIEKNLRNPLFAPYHLTPPATCRYGRYLVASRDVGPGEVIFSEAPLMWGPNNTNPALVCVGCYRSWDNMAHKATLTLNWWNLWIKSSQKNCFATLSYFPTVEVHGHNIISKSTTHILGKCPAVVDSLENLFLHTALVGWKCLQISG